jgi:futalosine hydrolase
LPHRPPGSPELDRRRVFQEPAPVAVQGRRVPPLAAKGDGDDVTVWVVAALEDEIALLVAELEARFQGRPGGCTHHMASVGQRQVRLAAVGAGVASAALNLGRLVAVGLPEAAIMVGSAGALPGSDLGVGDLVGADEEILAELGVLVDVGQGEAGQMGLADLVQAVPLDRSLTSEVIAATVSLGPVRRGSLLTVVGVSARPEQAEARARRFRALAENMEGYALALAGRRFGFPTAEIRGISNDAGDRDKSRWDLTAARERAQLAVLEYLKRSR